MNAQELRIGNLVEKGLINNIFQEDYEDHNYIYITANDLLALEQKKLPKRPYITIIPIRLSEEWLLKAGFELFPWGWVKNGILIRYNFSNNKYKYWIEIGNGTKIDLPFVHTLQNFMILTGTELTFKI